eukprot:gene2460-4779_t
MNYFNLANITSGILVIHDTINKPTSQAINKMKLLSSFLDNDDEAPNPREDFFKELRTTIDNNDLIKLILTDNMNIKSNSDVEDIFQIQGRLVMIKNGLHVQITLHYTTKHIIKNIPISDTIEYLDKYLQLGFKRIVFSNSELQHELILKRDSAKYKKKPIQNNTKLTSKNEKDIDSSNNLSKPQLQFQHDRKKNVPIDSKDPFLFALGVTTDTGRPKTGMADKLRQIQRFVEILSTLISKSNIPHRKIQEDSSPPLSDSPSLDSSSSSSSSSPGLLPLHVTDMGSGMGYLTFASHLYLGREYDVSTTGVEIRQGLVDQTNAIARSLGPSFSTLKFVQGDITTYGIPSSTSTSETTPVNTISSGSDINSTSRRVSKLPKRLPPMSTSSLTSTSTSTSTMPHTDILIALHACDTATDNAIYSGIVNNAEIIITVPCCHKEIRRQINDYQQLLLVKNSSSSKNNKIPSDNSSKKSTSSTSTSATTTATSSGTSASSAGGSFMSDILSHGIFRERQAEMVTDAIRALLLEIAGYETTVFEFVGGEHTAKNVMIAAVKRKTSTSNTVATSNTKKLKRGKNVSNKDNNSIQSQSQSQSPFLSVDSDSDSELCIEDHNGSSSVSIDPTNSNDSNRDHVESLWLRVEALMTGFGLKSQRLATLMGMDDR